MEWAVLGVVGLGALWYFILAMMGGSRTDNLKGFRWKLFALCLIWPITIIALVCILIWKAIFGRKNEASTSPWTAYAGSILRWAKS